MNLTRRNPRWQAADLFFGRLITAVITFRFCGKDILSAGSPTWSNWPDFTAATNSAHSAGERARRRAEERDDGRSVAEIETDLEQRDHLDSTRRHSPLLQPQDVADDAVVIDSTGKSAHEVLREVLACL